MKRLNTDLFSKWGLVAIVCVAFILRIAWLDRFPLGLHADEVSQGYNAYSLLKTGKDEHGVSWPVSLRAFGEWKPPLETYLTIPTIAFFGLSPWGIRLPSALFGTATVVLIYFLTRSLLQKTQTTTSYDANHVAITSALLLTISPWHILQSRVAMHGTIALFFWMLGILGFIKGTNFSRWFIISSIGFVGAIYAYYGMQVVVPLTLGLLIIWNWKVLGKLGISLL